MVKLKKTIILLTMAVVLSAADAFAQQIFVIKGRVMEAETKEPLIGASVRCGSTGTATDVDGNYELSMKEGSYDIECSYIGFENDRRRIILSCDTILDFSQQSSTSELSEVVVLSRSVMDRLKNAQPGMERIDLDECLKLPYCLESATYSNPCSYSPAFRQKVMVPAAFRCVVGPQVRILYCLTMPRL